MALRLSALVIILSSLKISRGALVLPRPPSSPNDINQRSSSSSSSSSGSKLFDEKLYNVKTRSQNSRTNVEKPNTDNYKLLEIELRDGGGGGPSVINFGEILREVFREEELPVKKEPVDLSSNKLLSYKDKMSVSDPPFGDNEKLYYLKQGRISGEIGRKRTSWEPRSYLKSVGAYDRGDKIRYATKSFYRPKKYTGDKKSITNRELGRVYDDTNYRPSSLREDIEKEDVRNRLIFGGNNYNEVVVTYSNEPVVEVYTTENSLPTSSELPKQIPPPPSRVPNQTIFTHTTPVLKYMSRRTDILPHGYAF